MQKLDGSIFYNYRLSFEFAGSAKFSHFTILGGSIDPSSPPNDAPGFQPYRHTQMTQLSLLNIIQLPILSRKHIMIFACYFCQTVGSSRGMLRDANCVSKILRGQNGGFFAHKMCIAKVEINATCS